MKIKILIVGLGSIGQRHMRNLLSLFPNEIELIGLRTKLIKRTILDNGEIINKPIEEVFPIKIYSDLSECLTNEKINGIIISNVTSKHASIINKVLPLNVPIFVEKPLTNSMDELKTLKERMPLFKSKIYIGFQFREHPLVKKVKDLVDSNKLGHIFSADCLASERIDLWHPYEDYRQSYAARKELGGGVVLTQAIHEIDLMLYLFGNPMTYRGITSKSTDIDTNVDDIATITLEYKDKTIVVFADYLGNPPRRVIRIRGDNGFAELDLLNASLVTAINGKVERIKNDYFVRNQMFVSEITKFVKLIKNEDIEYPSFDCAEASNIIALNILKGGIGE